MDSSDPIVASYDVFLTDSDIERYVFQYPDREVETKHGTGGPYDERHGQKPISFKLKPKTGLVEIDVPIVTSAGVYDVNRGLKYGEAMKQSRVLREGGSFGLAGGFNAHSTGGAGGNGGSRVKTEGGGEDVEMQDVKGSRNASTILRTQTLAGRMKEPVDGEPVYMLGAFRGSTFF
jgi:DNA-directed RNA polymerase